MGSIAVALAACAGALYQISKCINCLNGLPDLTPEEQQQLREMLKLRQVVDKAVDQIPLV